MGYDPSILHREQYASKLTAAERGRLKIQTAAEAGAKHSARQERLMHDEVRAFLQLKQIPFIHSRMDKRSTIAKGWPDFTCMSGTLPGYLGKLAPSLHARVCCVELKAPGGVISDDQAQVLAELRLAHVPAKVCYSSAEAIQFIIAELLT